MKRFVSFLVIISMLASSAVFVSYADDSELIYTDTQIEDLYYDFEYISGQVESYIFDDNIIAYRRYAKDREGKDISNKLIEIANRIIGEYPDKKYYTEVLVNMITLMEYDLSQQVENQAQFDNMKNIAEYGFDVVDIAAGFVGIDTDSETMEKILDVASDGIDLALDSVDEIKYYELIISNYSTSDTFLSAIHKYSDNEELKKAASDLRSANQALLDKRLETAATHADGVLTFTAENFFADFSYSIMKNLDAYKTDSVVKDYVDFGEAGYKNLTNLLSVGETVFKMASLGGDVVFGTTNTFRRHNEMMAMNDIANALMDACRDIDVSLSAPAQTVYSDIKMKCQYYNMILTTHMRGEHLIYNLNQNDAGILSAVASLLDCFKEEGSSIYNWYNRQIRNFEEYYDMVASVLAVLEQETKVVHEGFELHDGFIVEIERKTEVPEGYVGIYSYEDFKRIADSCPSDTHLTSIDAADNEINTADYILMNDITFPAEYDSAAVFYGSIDGNGYTMKNVSTPIFCLIASAEIKNLGIEVSYTVDLEDETHYYGAIAGSSYAFFNGDGVRIDNCFVKGSVDIACRSGKFGGLVGGCDGIGFYNCYNSADISIKTRQGGTLGGICGYDGNAVNSYNEGDLYLYTTCASTLDPEWVDVMVGGITGYMSWDHIENCYNTGTVKAETEILCQTDVGGIAGVCRYDSTIEDSYNVGQIINSTAETYELDDDYSHALDPKHTVGGIAGTTAEAFNILKCSNSGKVTGENYSGGIIGAAWGYEGDIENCYNTGSIYAVQYAGGIAGRNYKNSIEYCYNTGNVANALYCGAIAATIDYAEDNLTGCYFIDNGLTATYVGTVYSEAKEITAEDFTRQETFVDYDFFNIWKLRPDSTAPTLKHRTVQEDE